MAKVEEVRLAPTSGSVFSRAQNHVQLMVKRLQLPAEQVLEVVEQLAIMFETGLNLSQALEVLENQAGTPQLSRLVGSIRASVEEGQPLSNAMSREAWAFSPVSIALVRAGEMTGDLGGMLKKVAEFMERDISTRKKVKGALAYPVFMFIMAVGVVVFLLVNVFPKFAQLFAKNPEALPGPTRFFLNLSDFLTANGSWLAPVSLFSVVALVMAVRSKRGRIICDPIWVKTPAFGKLIKQVSISRSFHVLGVMMNAGLNVLEALALASNVAGNYVYEQLWDATKDEVENGKEISSTLMDNPLIPPAEAAMISLGERSGTLPEVLGKITKHHEKRVEGAIKAFVGVIEPMMTILMGFVVALIVTSLIMPMFSLSKVMK